MKFTGRTWGREREVEADGMNVQEEGLFGKQPVSSEERTLPQREGLLLWLRQQALTGSGSVEGRTETGSGLTGRRGT